MTEPCWCVQDIHRVDRLKAHYVLHGCERARRIMRLIVNRGMSLRAASVVVDAAMYEIGCTEGTVRAKIELEKAGTAKVPEKENNA
jgi:hypothetical protein